MASTDRPDTRDAPLHGRGIVITRPAAQAARLAQLVADAGGNPIFFPLIDICPLADANPARERLARLSDYDWVIFVSANAVEQGWALLPNHAAWPAHVRAAAVGTGTARALHAKGVAEVLLPAGRFDSEGLLELPALQRMTGRRVLIVRGVGGRELLAETLRARGAAVDYAECYERTPPATPVDVLLAAWNDRVLHAVTITSSEGLRHLHALLPEAGRRHLEATPLFVTHERMRATASALGLHDIVLTTPGDEGLYAALADYYTRRR